MATISARSFSAPAAAAPSSDVVIPDIVDTLEWVISSPPPIHQFAEPPVSISHTIDMYNNLC